MEARFLICLFLALTSCARAQLPVIQLPQVQPSGSTPLQLATNGAAYWWVSSDLATNTAISGNWTDRIQGASWKQPVSANQPTNSSTGIWFDANHFLTNNAISLGTSNIAIGLVLDMIDPTGGGATAPGILGINGALACTTSTVELGLLSASGYKLSWSDQCPDFGATSDQFGSLTNAFCDLIISQVVTNNNTMGKYCWTNSALSASGGNSIGTTLWEYWGASGGNPNYPQMLGRGTRSTGPKMRLREMIVWTNGTPGMAQGVNLSDTTRTNYHAYATNLYGYSP